MTASDKLDLLENVFSAETLDFLPDGLRSELVQKGSVSMLEEFAATYPDNPQPVDLLLSIAMADRYNSGIRRQAFQSLARLSQIGILKAIDSLFLLAVENEYPPAIQIIIAERFQPSSLELQALLDWLLLLPEKKFFPRSRLPQITRAYFNIASPELKKRLLTSAADLSMQNWADIVTIFSPGASLDTGKIITRFPAYDPFERELVIHLLSSQAQKSDPAAQETICLLFIHHEEHQALEIALQNQYLPQDPEKRAVFFFMAQDWDSYNRLDFDNNLLLNAYETADRALRRKLMEHSRKTGQLEWLQKSAHAGEVRWISDLTSADWELAIEKLSKRKQYTDLWRLSQSCPPHWSAVILNQLARQGWQPEQPWDLEEFERLVSLAQECTLSPLTVKPNKQISISPNELTCISVNQPKQLLAAGSSGHQITFWRLDAGDRELSSILSPIPVTRALLFSPDGELVSAACGDHKIRIFRVNDGKLLKTLEGHRSMIRTLAIHPEGRALFSAGYDGQIILWRFPYGPAVKTLHPDSGEIFQLASSFDGKFLLSAGISGAIQVWSLPEGTAARTIQAHSSAVSHIAASTKSEHVSSAGRDGWIRIWNYNSGRQVQSIHIGSDLITSLAFLPDDIGVISGHQSGGISIWNISTGYRLLQLSEHAATVNSLAFLSEAERLYSGDTKSNICSWQLNIFLSTHLSGLATRPGNLARYQELQKEAKLSEPEKKWLAFILEMLHWRQRFEIEVADLAPIEVGEFDIELD